MLTPANTRSPADVAFERFREVLADKQLFQSDATTLSESDTRAKLIDPLFKRVLGWHEADIQREAPVAKGYVDYVLGSGFKYVLIEAKRTTPRFSLSAPDKPRRLKLSGPHLLGNKKIKPFIEQAQGYSSDTGAQFCVVTNGTQLIVFRPHEPGRSWRLGTAIVYHDHRDILQHFAEFYSLLARQRVVSGSLVEAFEHLERTTVPLYAPIDSIAAADRELVRNPLWAQISRTMGPLLTDQSEDPASQLEVIANCYVSTPLAAQADSSLNALLRDVPSTSLVTARFVDLKPGERGRTAFSHKLEADVHQARKGAYILTGGVGSGKTTFLRRFANIVERDFVEKYTAWFHVDFLSVGNASVSTIDNVLARHVYRVIRGQIMNVHGETIASSGDQVRALFAAEINQARLTTLFGIDEQTPEWNRAVNSLTERLLNDDQTFVSAAVRYLRSRGLRVAVVLDNTDQMGEEFQGAVFLLSQKLAADYHAICIVTLREEKFFAAYRRGIFDAYGDRRFHIGSPDLRQVLRRRLEYGLKKFEALESSSDDGALTAEDLSSIRALIRALIRSTTGKNANIARMLASVSNGDMRHALDMFREFLSSGNTNIEKIISIVERSGGYTVPFHEFAKSAILGSRRYYRSSVSHVANLFKQTDALGSSHLTACRILMRLTAASGAASPHGEGYVELPTILREYRDSFGVADDCLQWGAELLRRSLIESEPPRVANLVEADAIRITAAGAYYWNYLVRSFAYVDLVFVDTPISDHAVARRLATMAEMTDMSVRFERVRAFLDYLRRKEGEELALVAQRVGPFQEALVPTLASQIESEIRTIAKKTRVRDEYPPDKEQPQSVIAITPSD